MDVVAPIVSAVLLIIMVPVIGGIAIRLLSTVTTEELAAHAASDDKVFVEIRNSITHLGDKLDANTRTLLSELHRGR